MKVNKHPKGKVSFSSKCRQSQHQKDKYTKVFINDLNGKSFIMKRKHLKLFTKTGNKKYLSKGKDSFKPHPETISMDRTFIVVIEKPTSPKED